MRHKPSTKIVATLGPATSSDIMVSRLIKTGVDIFRLNFSHGDFDFHSRLIRTIREQSSSIGRPIGIMQDLPGPKIRIGRMPDGGIELVRGQRIILDCSAKSYSIGIIPVPYSNFCRDVHKGDHIYINDGAIRLEAAKVNGSRVYCRTEIGGIISSNKGINLPGTKVSAPTFTRRDRECVKFGIEQGIDFIAMSFVRSANDIKVLRSYINRHNGNQFIISKIEKREALDDFDDILRNTDGIMIARGDLGIELPIEQVPGIQKDLIRRCNQAGKPVITATQVLESMTQNPRPTRAEATDAANAILDGTDALMLSGETAVGSFPVESVKTIVLISHETEKGSVPLLPLAFEIGDKATYHDYLAWAVSQLADELNIQVIAAPTRSGRTARLISRFRPSARIIAFSQSHHIRQHLLLSWGVEPLAIDQRLKFDDLIARIKRILIEWNIAGHNERIIITAGSPGSKAGETNLFMMEQL